jgi:hypothetical protein
MMIMRPNSSTGMTARGSAIRRCRRRLQHLALSWVSARRAARGEAISFPVEGIDGGSISMLTARIG